jgi:hypothetical protein
MRVRCEHPTLVRRFHWLVGWRDAAITAESHLLICAMPPDLFK